MIRTPLPPSAIVYLAGLAAALHVGKLPPALPALQAELGLTLVQAGLLVSAFQVAGMSMGLFGGLLADRFGLRRAMLTGLAVMAAAGIAGGFATAVLPLAALRALESAGFILTVLPGPALLRRVTPLQRMSVALGVWGSYMPAGMALGLVVAPWLIGAGGWPLAWWGVSAATASAWLLVLRGIPADGARTGASPRAGALARDTLASAGPWLLALCFGCYAGQWMVVFSFLPTAYQDAGIAPRLAAALTAAGVAVNLLGNVAAGALLARGASRAALVGGASAAMAACAWVAFGSGLAFPARYAGVLVFSAVGGLVPGALFATAPRLAPHAGAVSTTTGLMQQGSSLGQFLTPPLVAAVASASGGWQRTWWVTGALALANVAVAVLLARAVARADRSSATASGRSIVGP